MKEEFLIRLALFILGLGVAGLWNEITQGIALKKIAKNVERFANEFSKTVNK